ncbi:MAG: TRAP transporter fused permease subunit [Betaproteobacteria bacterium]|nr:TRAP transporter fused permease subunit [Betaproteobacteria bacterium]
MASDLERASPDLQQLVADSDTGGRKPTGITAALIFALSIAWGLFQFWYASPMPFELGFGVLNDTEARAIHLAFALFLAFMVWPAFKRSSETHVPLLDWLLALAGAFAGAYLMLFYADVATRPGQPSSLDVVIATVGLALLLEATRRSVGWPMAALAALFIVYALAGPYMPEVLEHKGASWNRLISHMWLTTEGVYGIALGVSTGAIFVYVLFGALLDRAGGGNYMMQVSFAALGHLRGGPAKVAVVSSALNGMISGSSVSNVVSGGIFTIPLMKKAGYGGVKAGAIETMSSVNGQIMPPVMGAAAFLMVEYVGISYAEIVRHALLPAVLSYVGLFYIVHLEAVKMGMHPLIRREFRPWHRRALRLGFGLSGTLIVIALLYLTFEAMKAALGPAAPYAIGTALIALYLFAIRQAAISPDLPQDINLEQPTSLNTWPAVRAGLHFLMPIGTLIWCLMVEELSPSLSAFWAVTTLLVLMLTQHPLIAWFRKLPAGRHWLKGWNEVVAGFNDGSRNMIGIGIATAAAGIIVGGITLTGLGLRTISGEDAIATGIQGAKYALRTVILPFIWIFNTQLLLVDIETPWEFIRVVTACTVAMLVFCALTMGWFRDQCRRWEMAALTLAVALLFRPGFFMDQIATEYADIPTTRVFEVAQAAESGEQLVMVIKGTSIEGADLVKTVALRLGEAGSEGRKRLADAGLQLVPLGEQLQIGPVKFGSQAKKGGFEQGWQVAEIKVRTDRPTPHWFYLPALILVGWIWWLQGQRLASRSRSVT